MSLFLGCTCMHSWSDARQDRIDNYWVGPLMFTRRMLECISVDRMRRCRYRWVITQVMDWSLYAGCTTCYNKGGWYFDFQCVCCWHSIQRQCSQGSVDVDGSSAGTIKLDWKIIQITCWDYVSRFRFWLPGFNWLDSTFICRFDLTSPFVIVHFVSFLHLDLVFVWFSHQVLHSSTEVYGCIVTWGPPTGSCDGNEERGSL